MKIFVNTQPSTLNKCVNRLYMTFGNLYVISLTKMTK